jgi:acetyl-CoA synthetase
MLDFPRADRCDVSEFETTVAAWESASVTTGAATCVVASLPESMPEEVAQRLMGSGIAPMQGIGSCLAAIDAASRIGAAQDSVAETLPLPRARGPVPGTITTFDEVDAKAALAAYGVPVPESALAATPEEAATVAARLGFPVVLKAVADGLAHKSDVGGVVVGLATEDDVRRAAGAMSEVAERFLVERLVPGAMLELLVGVQRDPRLGLGLTVGSGGVLVELVDDSATVLLPASRAEIRTALSELRVGPVLSGFRGRSADLDAVVSAVEAVAAYAVAHADRLVEIEVNPLLVLPASDPRGAVAVDALIRLAEG